MELADRRDLLARVGEEVQACRACPRLVEWREQMGREKRAAYRHEHYWARGVPGFGDPDAHLAVVGLAPAAHGANRTGRMFTGDGAASGTWLYRALHRFGYCSQPDSTHRGDGLTLTEAWVTSAVKCAPPANRPTTGERDNCLPFLSRELSALKNLRVVITLGGFAHQVVWRELGTGPRPRFGHGVEAELSRGRTLLCSYHPSQQNTFTKRLTETMFDEVFARARALGLLPR